MSGNQPAMQPVSLSFTLWVSLSVIHTESEWVGESVSYSVHHLVHKSKSTSPLVRDYKSSQLLYNSLLTDVQTHPQQLSSCKAVWVKLDWGRENILPKQQQPLWPKQSSSQNIQYTHCISFSSFVWDQIFASQIKTKEDIFLRWNWLPYGSALNSPCLVQSPLSVQCIKTVPWPNIQHTLCISFSSSLWDQVFASQIKTKEEFCWVKLTPLRISSKVTHNSCTKSTLCSANKDSPVAKTFSTLTAFPFPLSCGTKSLHHRLRLRKSFVGWNWLLYGSALKSPITLVQSLLSVLQIKTVQ